MTVWILTLCAVVFCFFQLYRVKRWRDSLHHRDALSSVQAVAVHKDKPARKKASKKAAKKTTTKAKRATKRRSKRKTA